MSDTLSLARLQPVLLLQGSSSNPLVLLPTERIQLRVSIKLPDGQPREFVLWFDILDVCNEAIIIGNVYLRQYSLNLLTGIPIAQQAYPGGSIAHSDNPLATQDDSRSPLVLAFIQRIQTSTLAMPRLLRISTTTAALPTDEIMPRMMNNFYQHKALSRGNTGCIWL